MSEPKKRAKHALRYGTIVVLAGILIWLLYEQFVIYDILPKTSPSFFSAVDPNTISNLLGITSQILTTILAIVFSLVLVAAEVASRFTSRIVDQVFTKQTIVYMIAFILISTFSLMLIVTKGSFPQNRYVAIAEIAIVLTFACLLYLPLYLSQAKEWLKIRNLCEDMEAKGEKAIKKGERLYEVKEVQALYDLASNLKAGKSYEDLSFSIEALRKLAICATKVGKTEIAIGIVHKVSDLSALMLDDVESAKRFVATLGRFIQPETIKTPVAQTVKERLHEIIREAIDREVLLAKRVIYEIGSLGGYFVLERLEGPVWILDRLEEISRYVIGKRQIQLAHQVIGATCWIGRLAAIKATAQDDLASVRKHSLMKIQSYFRQAMINDMPEVASEACHEIVRLQDRISERRFDEKYFSSFIALQDLEFGKLEWCKQERKRLLTAAVGATDYGLEKVTESIVEAFFQIACNDKDESAAQGALFRLRIVISWAAANREKLFDHAKKWVSYMIQVGDKTPFPAATVFVAEQAFAMCVEGEKVGQPLPDLPKEFCVEIINHLRTIKTKINAVDPNADGAYQKVRGRVKDPKKLALLDELKVLYDAR